MRTLYVLMLFFAGAAAALADPKFDYQADVAERNSKAKAQSHCIGEERVIFTCRIGEKIASVCASPYLDANQGYLQYRFGHLNSAELQIPPKRDYKPSMVGYMNALLASSSGSYIRFTKGNYRYYIFSASVRGADDPQTGASTRDEPSGVVVKKNGKIIYARHCTSAAFDDNLSEHVLGKAVTILSNNNDVDPFDLAFPTP